jgi:hypothetical protein
MNMNTNISLSFLSIILRVLRQMRFPYTVFTLQTNFKPLLLKGGGRVNPSVDVAVNSTEEDFFTNYVQEFGLRI